jgi:hypothetical protein
MPAITQAFTQKQLRNHINDLTPLELFKYGLLWARQGLTREDLGLYINRDKSNAGRWTAEWIETLYPWATEQITFLPEIEWLLHTPEELRKLYPNHLFLFVDGTVLKMWTPSDAKCRRKQHNSKHGFSAWVFFIVVDPSGHIVFLSRVELGNKHDATHWNESGAVELLEEFYSEVRIDCDCIEFFFRIPHF